MVLSLILLGACGSSEPEVVPPGEVVSSEKVEASPSPVSGEPSASASPSEGDKAAKGSEKGAKGEPREGGDAAPPADGNAEDGPPPSEDEGCSVAAFAEALHPQGGDTVTLSGSLSGFKGQGVVILEIVAPTDKRSVYSYSCKPSASFSVSLPADLGEVGFVALLDADSDGPSVSDAGGRHPGMLQVGTEDIGGISIVLSDPAQLGDLTPPYTLPNRSPAEPSPDAAPENGEVILPGKKEGERDVPAEAPPAGEEAPKEGAGEESPEENEAP